MGAGSQKLAQQRRPILECVLGTETERARLLGPESAAISDVAAPKRVNRLRARSSMRKIGSLSPPTRGCPAVILTERATRRRIVIQPRRSRCCYWQKPVDYPARDP